MSDISILNELNDMIRLLEISLEDAEKLVSKGNHTAGMRVRKTMQEIKKRAKNIRNMVQLFKKV